MALQFRSIFTLFRNRISQVYSLTMEKVKKFHIWLINLQKCVLNFAHCSVSDVVISGLSCFWQLRINPNGYIFLIFSKVHFTLKSIQPEANRNLGWKNFYGIDLHK